MKYIGIFITKGSKPHLSYRISKSKAWCSRHINYEDYRAECCKDFSQKKRLIMEIEALEPYIENIVCTTEFDNFVKEQLWNTLNIISQE